MRWNLLRRDAVGALKGAGVMALVLVAFVAYVAGVASVIRYCVEQHPVATVRGLAAAACALVAAYLAFVLYKAARAFNRRYLVNEGGK